MLFVLPWICWFGAAAALAVLIHDYKKEERALKEVEENTLIHKR